MGVSDRLVYFIIGCAIGFVLGYIVRSLRIIRSKLNENGKPTKDDSGIARYPLIMNISLALVVGLTVISAFRSQVAANNSDNSVDALQRSGVISCQNANETREANLTLWNFVLNASLSGGKNQTPREKLFIEQIRTWIAKLYAPHDCSDLNKKYTIPPPPPILDVTPKKHHK